MVSFSMVNLGLPVVTSRDETVPFELDEAILDLLPKGSQYVSSKPHGESAWVHTRELVMTSPTGQETKYFLKVGNGADVETILQGEYETTRLINQSVPDMMPKVFGWGECKKSGARGKEHFLLSEFVELDSNTRPDPVELAELYATKLHQITAPNGLFGFHVTTCCGRVVFPAGWHESWADCYTKLFKSLMEQSEQKIGMNQRLQAVSRQIIDKVVPRLLGNLKDDGEPIKPRLLHGDFCDDNVAIRKDTGKIIAYDANGYFGHNECDLGYMRWEKLEWWSGAKYFNDEAYYREYRRAFQPSEPEDEWDDRNRLYRTLPHLVTTVHWGNVPQAQTLYNDLCYLCEKYAPLEGLGAWDSEKDPTYTNEGDV